MEDRELFLGPPFSSTLARYRVKSYIRGKERRGRQKATTGGTYAWIDWILDVNVVCG